MDNMDKDFTHARLEMSKSAMYFRVKLGNKFEAFEAVIQRIFYLKHACTTYCGKKI